MKQQAVPQTMPDSMSIHTAHTYEGTSGPRSRTSTYSIDSSNIATATATASFRTSEVDTPSLQLAAAHAMLRHHEPDTSADLTRNWLTTTTTTAPPLFSRKGVADVIMPIKARPLDDVPKEMRTESRSEAQQEERRRRAYDRHQYAESQLQPRGSMRVRRSEEGEKESQARQAEERTLGWVKLSRGMSTSSSRRPPGLREGRNNRDTQEENDGRGTVTSDGELGLGIAGVDGRKLRRKWPWDSFLKIVDKKLGKKGIM